MIQDECGPGQGKRRGAKSGAKDVTLFPQRAIDDRGLRTIVCCVDDTDDVSGSTSTGYVSQLLAEAVCALGGRVELGITRHQLLIAEGVPYTSHNSSMCFTARFALGKMDEFRAAAERIIRENSVEAADPGLCVAIVPEHLDSRARDQIASLVEFGRAAQSRLCTKDEAYALAAGIDWVSLDEYGGTGDGVIGAIAGAGLRLGGTDGRFRGAWDMARLLGGPRASGAQAAGDSENVQVQGAFSDESAEDYSPAAPGASGAQPQSAEEPDAPQASVSDVVREVERLAGGPVQVVQIDSWEPLRPDARVLLSAKAKPIYLNGMLTFVAEPRRDGVALCEKVDLGKVGCGQDWSRACESFALDNDVEECVSPGQTSCRNCLYRRWTERGFSCMLDADRVKA